MPRLPQDEVKQREEFALEVFKANPGLSAAKANAMVQERFGSQIRAKRIYELRQMADHSAGTASPSPKPPAKLQARAAVRAPVQMAARKAAYKDQVEKPVKPASIDPKSNTTYSGPAILIEGKDSELQFLAKSMETLNRVRMCHLAIEDAGEGYVLVHPLT